MTSVNRSSAAPRRHSWLWGLAVLAFVLIVVLRLSELEQLLRVALQGIWYLVLAALLLEGVYIANQAALYSSLSQLTHRPVSTQNLLLPLVAADFLEVAAPTPLGNVPGVALIVSQVERLGMSRTEALLMNVLYFVLDYAAFLTVLAAGLLYLSLFHDLRPYELVAAFCLFAVVAVSVGLIVWAILRPAATGAWVGAVGMKAWKRWSAFRRLPPPSGERIADFVSHWQASVDLLRQGGRKLIPPVLHAFAIPAIQLLMLASLFLAFRSPVGPGVLVAGYAVGTLLTIIAITPAGLGPVEGMMILTYSSLGVPPETATLVTLVYRGFTFWLPLGGGFLAMRRLP
jgi:glycosyltransferase 2 family protein